MILSDISIRRPVLATVMTLLIVLVGIIAYDRLSVREYPNIDVPVVTVATTYFGANAAIMESQVTKILEDSLSGIEGIDFMTSVSRSESSQITINFKLTRDADAAANDVRDRVARVRGQLPDAIEEPIVSKEEADAQPIIYMAFSSDRHDMLEVTDVANRLVKDRVQTIDGVANVRIFGERRYSMRIWLDRARMAAFRVIPDSSGPLPSTSPRSAARRVPCPPHSWGSGTTYVDCSRPPRTPALRGSGRRASRSTRQLEVGAKPARDRGQSPTK